MTTVYTIVYNLYMPFSIKDPKADQLVRELAKRTGETLTEAIVVSVRERLNRIRSLPSASLAQEIERIAKRCGSRPVRDTRAAEDILGYDGAGLPT
ncbi:MAG TPA: type II toxin-antitoxin system VapB family antitoxin [Candidatus Lustribacter sp.]